MGVVKGITSTEFPVRDRDEFTPVVLQARFGIFPATLVRRDRSNPFNTIWKIEPKHLPRKYFAEDRPLYVADSHLQQSKFTPICRAGELEGRFVDVIFDHNKPEKCEGVIVTHRGQSLIILLTTGPHEGRLVTGGECQYRITTNNTKDYTDEQI